MAPTPKRARMTLAALLLSLVTILSSADPSVAQQTAPDSQLPAPALTAQATDDAVELRWQSVDRAVRYELRSWTEAGGWQQLGGENLTATTFNHTAPAPGLSYYYWVRAVDAAGQPGAWSQRESATLPETHSPAPTPTPTPTPTAPQASAPTLTPTPTPTAPQASRRHARRRSTGFSADTHADAHTYRSTGFSAATHADAHTYRSTGFTPTLTPTATPAAPQASAPPLTPTPTPTAPQASAPTPTPTESPTPTDSPTQTALPTPTPTPTSTDTSPLSVASSELSGPHLIAEAKEGAVDLRWDNVDGAKYYDLRSYTVAGGWQRLGGENLTGTTFNHTGLTAGVTYYYWVRGMSGPHDPSPWSQRVPATVPSPQSPTPTPTTPIPTTTPTQTPAQTPSLKHRLLRLPQPRLKRRLNRRLNRRRRHPTPTAATPDTTDRSADADAHFDGFVDTILGFIPAFWAGPGCRAQRGRSGVALGQGGPRKIL